MHYIPFTGYTLAYDDQGRGRPVVLLHGFPLDHTMWTAQIADLSKGYRIIAPDLRGFGESTLRKQDGAEGIAMADYAEDLARTLDHIGISEPIVLCGFSMGGYVAWQFLQKFPERIAGLILCDTRAVGDNEEGKKGRIEMADNVGKWGSAKVAEKMEPKLFAESTRTARRDVVDHWNKVIASMNPDAIAAAQRGMAERPDVTDLLPLIKYPTQVIVGEHDAISSKSEMTKIADQMPYAEIAVIPGAGHMSPVENPPAVTAAMGNFLRRL